MIKETVAFVFGRMNPISKGHLLLLETLENQPADDKFIYLSHTQDAKKNPIDYDNKIKFTTRVIEEHMLDVEVIRSNARTAIEVLTDLTGSYNNVIFVAGGDRVDEFKQLMDTYNGKPDSKGIINYSFDSIEVVSAGKRDDKRDDVSGISASKMRDAVKKEDYEAFASMSPFSNDLATKDLYDKTREGLKL